MRINFIVTARSSAMYIFLLEPTGILSRAIVVPRCETANASPYYTYFYGWYVLYEYLRIIFTSTKESKDKKFGMYTKYIYINSTWLFIYILQYQNTVIPDTLSRYVRVRI